MESTSCDKDADLRILIADDDEIAREILSRSLKKWNFEIFCVEDGDKASKAINDNLIDIALVDWNMPGMNGLELCRFIRSLSTDKYIYTIIFTARDSAEDRISGLEAGADDYITKPFKPDELRARINTGKRIVELQRRLLFEQSKVNQYAREMEELAKERAQQLIHSDRMATLGLLSAGIAHEINNPTTFISGNIQFIEKALRILDPAARNNQALQQNQKKQVEFALDELYRTCTAMRSGTERISKIVNELRLFAGNKKSIETRFDIKECINQALSLCHNKLKYHAKVSTTFASDLPLVTGDSQQIEQVIVNLLINAADATEQNENAAIDISTSGISSGIEINVGDNGTGIPLEYLDKIWQPFFTTKPTGKGTGLGLAICLGIVENHKGSIKVKNRLPQGALFTIFLPAAVNIEETQNANRT